MSQALPETLESRLTEAFGTDAVGKLSVPGSGVVAVVLAYNEALRFPYFLEHYRALGISHFIIVDNASSDGTRALLKGMADVSVIPTDKPYRDHKSEWRQLLCERYLQERWVIFPDVDELFVYPGWPERPIGDLTDYLDTNGYRALFCPMVDMYPGGPLKNVSYRPGQSFLDACPWFDGSGYRLAPLKGSHRKRYKTPARHVFGGARERLFHHNSKRPGTWVDNFVLKTFFSLKSPMPKTRFGRLADHLLFKLVKNALPDTAAVQSKIPLIRWGSGYKFSGGVHGIAQEIPVAPVWGALLHFKYLDDFQSKVSEALERRQHTDNAGHYREYDAQMALLMKRGPFDGGSTRFTGMESLLSCGLVRGKLRRKHRSATREH